MFGQILVNGLVLSGGYALVAVGLTLTFGVMRMVNFAEGQSVMIGAFVAYTAVPYVGYVGAIAAAMAVNAVLGIILERTAFRPFRGVELNGLIASMGMPNSSGARRRGRSRRSTMRLPSISGRSASACSA
jgi:branched-chain amino acid transport system permease protein